MAWHLLRRVKKTRVRRRLHRANLGETAIPLNVLLPQSPCRRPCPSPVSRRIYQGESLIGIIHSKHTGFPTPCVIDNDVVGPNAIQIARCGKGMVVAQHDDETTSPHPAYLHCICQVVSFCSLPRLVCWFTITNWLSGICEATPLKWNNGAYRIIPE